MSIKQGELLKKLRVENKLSQEQLAEKLELSRQSISKWEQGVSTPDIDNFVKLAELYNVSVDSLLKGSLDEEQAQPVEKPQPKEEKPKKQKKKRGWLFVSYPIIMAIAYAIIGSVYGNDGWAYGWMVFLTIPLFYTGIIAVEKKKPVIFCYPVLVAIVFLLFGFFKNMWHPMWILFLTIPLFYIIASKKK
jgi:transcriptional regulator with XRE-family HTH domain